MNVIADLCNPCFAQRGTHKLAQPRHAPREQGDGRQYFHEKIRGGIQHRIAPTFPLGGTSLHLETLEKVRYGRPMPRVRCVP